MIVQIIQEVSKVCKTLPLHIYTLCISLILRTYFLCIHVRLETVWKVIFLHNIWNSEWISFQVNGMNGSYNVFEKRFSIPELACHISTINIRHVELDVEKVFLLVSLTQKWEYYDQVMDNKTLFQKALVAES